MRAGRAILHVSAGPSVVGRSRILPQDAKDQIRERLSLADVIGESVALKPAGKGQLKGLCPFHAEKTPSFHVHVDRGFYYCFGCHAKGDLFDFVMQTQGLDFVGALTLLGARAGVEVTPQAPKDHRRRDLFEVNQMALRFFRSQLEGDALGYLASRGLERASIDAFELGYAPDGWDGLLRHALTKGVRDEDLLNVGLVAGNDRGRVYDRFRNRVMFPIKDAMGRCVGFAGRVLDDSLPKYLNTAETELFHKSELLYGLDRARPSIRKQGEVIVVEGYMDVIALHQTGFGTAVGALGAALTAEQAEQLVRLDAKRVYLAFDADEAGQRAVLSGLDQSVGSRLLVSAITVPNGKDPAEAVLSGHVEEFRHALANGRSEVEFRFQRVLDRFDKDSVEGQRGILEELLPVLKPRDVFDPVAAEMRRLVLEHLGIDGDRLDAWIRSNVRRPRGVSTTQVRGLQRQRLEMGQVKALEYEVIALLLAEPRSLRRRLEAVIAAVPEGLPDSILFDFRAACERHAYDAQAVLLGLREREQGALVFERLVTMAQQGEASAIDVDAALAKEVSRLRELHIEALKEDSRARLLSRREELGRLAGDTRLPPEQLHGVYEELKEIQAMLSARDSERRTRVSERLGKGRRGRVG